MPSTDIRHRLSPGARERVKAVLCHPAVGHLLGKLFRDRIPSWGCRINTSGHQVTPVTKASLFWRVHERQEIRFLQRYLRDDLDVVELGGSLGVVSCQIRRKIRPERTLVVVEADPDLVPVAEENLATNAPGRVHVLNAAVTYDTAEDRVRFSGGASTQSGAVDPGGDGDLSVPRVTLSDLVCRFDLADYALVSDIEGAEAGLIARGEVELASCRQMIIELHDTTHGGQSMGPDAMVEHLRDLGFELVDQQGRVCVLEREESMPGLGFAATSMASDPEQA